MFVARPSKVRCRPIDERDLLAVATLLVEGFPDRTLDYWRRGLARMAARAPVEGCPRFGYMLEADGAAVGVILLIFTDFGDGSAVKIRCNISSWYVAPEFRAYAAQLSATALKLKHVTYLNISPAEHTWPLLTAQGYRRYSDGQFVCIPALSRGGDKARIRAVTSAAEAGDVAEHDLLAAHADAGCLSLVCESAAGAAPFVLAPRRVAYSPLRLMQLVYCRDTGAFVRRAGAIGRFLLRRGVVGVILDANAPVPGLAGRYFDGRQPKYFKGEDRPRLNDLAFTETVLFGA
ncbi:MAG TPA: hypothetical protein VHY32_06810 [Caulobacteraceae bacterium]|jgi:hypothetical protein|nr:hypothetical protein [Caulobacteraceae bacterium]